MALVAGRRTVAGVVQGPNASAAFFGRRAGVVGVAPGAGGAVPVPYGGAGGVGGMGSFRGLGSVGGVGAGGAVAPGYGYADADCCGTSHGPGFGGGVAGGGDDCCAAACGPAGVACADGCAAVGCGGAACGGAGCGTNGSILTYVGAGGDYVQETTYRYVGGGAGTFGLVPIGTPGNCCVWVIPLGLCLLLLPLLMLLMWGSGTTTTTTTSLITSIPPTGPIVPGTTTGIPPPGRPGICIIRGDPHITTFDGRHISFYSRGEYWIVRSNSIWIQARYMPTPVTHGLSATKEIAFGGPFLDGKILRVSALTASFDGQPILTTFPSQFTNPSPAIIAEYNAEGAILQHGRQGKPLRVVHLGLPNGVSAQINRWNEPGEGVYINVQITMPQQPAQDGHCGNFNGNIEDDRRLAIRARVGTTGVAPNELLFNTKTPVVAPTRPDLNNCPEEKANHAKALCKSVATNGIPSHDCMVDVCFGGDQFAFEGDYD